MELVLIFIVYLKTFTMYSFFIGIDVSKDYLDVSYVLFGKLYYLGRFENCDSGYLSMIQELKVITESDIQNWFFCFENTGVYSKDLLFWLYENGIAYREENPIQIYKSLGLKRGKNDKADSKAIALYAYEKRDSIQPSKPAELSIRQLKKLAKRRDFLVKQRTAANNSFNMNKRVLDEALLVVFTEQHNAMILLLDSQIKEIEIQIKRVLSEDERLSKNNELLQSIVGIGDVVSSYILAYTENFERITEARKLAAFIGVAPFENSSGKSKGKTKVSNLANKKLKSVMSNAALSAIQHDPQIAVYYKRKMAEGKLHGVVINAVKNKLLHRVYAVINRQTPYVKFAYA